MRKELKCFVISSCLLVGQFLEIFVCVCVCVRVRTCVRDRETSAVFSYYCDPFKWEFHRAAGHLVDKTKTS